MLFPDWKKWLLSYLNQALFWRPRILPLVILTAALLFSVKLSHLFEGKADEAFTVATPLSAADGNDSPSEKPKEPTSEPKKDDASAPGESGGKAADKSDTPNKEGDKDPKENQTSDPSAKEGDSKEKQEGEKQSGDKQDSEQQDGDKQDGGAKAVDTKANDSNKPFDPLNMTETEVKLLVTLSQRHKELEKKQEDIKSANATLELVGKRMDEKLKELQTLEEKINAHIKNYDDQAEKNLAKLAKFYEDMKPSAAAKIFDDMNVGLIIEITMRMNSRKVAPIISAMDPDKAKELSTLIATRKPLFLPIATVDQKNPPSANSPANVQAPKDKAPSKKQSS